MPSFRPTPAALALCLLLALPALASAAPFQPYGQAGPSGTFAASCSGPADGGLANPNVNDNQLFFKTGSDCQAGPGAAASSVFGQGNVAAAGQGGAALGVIQGQTSMSTDAQNTVLFPAGFVDLGWIDTLTIVSPGNQGELALVTVALNVTGLITADGPNVFGRTSVVANAERTGGAFDFIKTYQLQAGSGTTQLPVGEVLTFDLPFTVGVAQQFMIRMLSQSMTSSQTSFGNNTATTQFQNTLTWGGIQQVSVGGNVIMPDDIVSDSGIDWRLPATVPEPALGLLAGALLLGARRFAR